MRKIILLLAVCFSIINLSAQASYRTGDNDFDADLININTKAKGQFSEFKIEMAQKYSIDQKKIEHMHVSLKMAPAEIYLALEIGKISQKPVDDILVVYKNHKNDGWGYIAKEMGIKPGTDKFHSLKTDTHKHKYNVAPAENKKPENKNDKAQNEPKKNPDKKVEKNKDPKVKKDKKREEKPKKETKKEKEKRKR